jgi:23S rRNA U2552 (ribose-2'-O)-methylase RlmE/FtsJ
MTTRQTFIALMRERRAWPKGSADHEYRSRAARKLVWIMRGIPVLEWKE